MLAGQIRVVLSGDSQSYATHLSSSAKGPDAFLALSCDRNPYVSESLGLVDMTEVSTRGDRGKPPPNVGQRRDEGLTFSERRRSRH